MIKVLVTGGAGFIGSNIALKLVELGNDVTILDNFSSGHKNNIKNFKGKIIEHDVSKSYEYEKYDAIFHQAAITDPRHPNDNETFKQNINGFINMLNLAKKNNSKLIYASTASLYGNTKAPQVEDQEKELLSAYAQSKIIMDEIACHNFNQIHIVGLRYFNVFGPFEASKGRPASMVYHLAKKMLSGENPKIFKNGEHKRDFIYVKDCVLANILALNCKSGIYNVGTGVATSFNELVSTLNKVIGTSLEPIYIDMPYDAKSYQNHTEADTSRAKSILKFTAEYPLTKAISEYITDLK